MTEQKKSKPIYVHRLPPCNNACPIGQNIQKWLELTKQDKFKEAWHTIMANNPLPATIGRVCYHPCESVCNRFHYDSAVNINGVERFLGDMALEEGWRVDPIENGFDKNVLIVGAGPAGLSAAFHLRLLGHKVTIFEAAKVAGGIMHYGIPSYRLPRDILDKEIARIEDMGVVIEYERKVEDLLAEKAKGGFDAVFVAVGAPVGRKVDIPTSGNSCNVIDAMDFLAAIENDTTPEIAGHKVIVYGGGNTAIDAARCAVRVGARKVEIVYRRNREKMPAYDFEIAEGMGEGVTLRLLRTIKQIDENDITLDIMELNEEGWPCPTDTTEMISADTIIMALGLNVNTEFLRKVEGLEFKKDNTVLVDEHMQTGCAGVFAGGDVIPYDRTVATAIGHGKKAAVNIDTYLHGELYHKPEKNEMAGLDLLHTSYYEKADRKARTQIPLTESKQSFAEVIQGLTEDETMHEAQRCFSCGNCFECDTCYNVCPVKAINKLGAGKGYSFNYDACIRCGLCARKCPCGAIKMVEDE